MSDSIALVVDLGAQGPAGTGITTTQYNDILTRLGALEDGALIESAVASSTPVVDSGSVAPGVDTAVFDFFVLPTTSVWFVITDIQWKNGATAIGTLYPRVYAVDADPPVAAGITLVAWGVPTAQSGINAVQGTARVMGAPIRGGTTLGVCVISNNAGSTFRRQILGVAENHKKGLPATGNPAMADASVWIADTDACYLQAFYRGIS